MGSFMEYYLPKFKTLLSGLLSERNLFARGFDYVVPIESKGAMLLNNVMAGGFEDLQEKVMFLRAFDYMRPEELADKNILLVDDIVIYGGSLERWRIMLREKGVTNVTKAAFLRHPKFDKIDVKKAAEVATEEERERKNVRSGFPVELEEYHTFATEITEFYVKERPTYPDHFKVTVVFSKPIEPRVLDDYGTLVRYDRSAVHNEWSIHYPIFRPEGKSSGLKYYDSAFKIRMRNDARDPLRWKISPVVFPSLLRKPSVDELDASEKALHNILFREWHDDAVREADIYESITLAERINGTSALLNYLESRGIEARSANFDAKSLSRYFGRDVAGEIERKANDMIGKRKDLPIEEGSQMHDFDLFKIPRMRLPILALLDEKYESHPENLGKPPWEKKPVGLTVEKIASELGESLATTSVACEAVNDYGFVVPMIDGFSRKYRDCEIGKELLKHEAR